MNLSPSPSEYSYSIIIISSGIEVKDEQKTANIFYKVYSHLDDHVEDPVGQAVKVSSGVWRSFLRFAADGGALSSDRATISGPRSGGCRICIRGHKIETH